MTIDPTKKDDHQDHNVDHLDFNPRCSVGHVGGARRNVLTGENFEPCEQDAVFVSKVHAHDSENNVTEIHHLWCVEHLSEFTVEFQTWIADTTPPDIPICERCRMEITNVGDLIFDLKAME